MGELTGIFGDVVNRAFIAGNVQNWTQEPYIRGSYSMSDLANGRIEGMLAPIAGKIFFAGEVLGGTERATVHGAAFSAINAVDEVQQS